MISALVPAKPLDQAKGRLAAIMGEEERRALSLAMLEDILRALGAVSRIESVSVVSPDAQVLRLVESLGAQPVEEPPSVRGINQALAHAAENAAAEADALLVVLADVPAITPSDVDAVLDALDDRRGVVICPSHDRGTSVLALRPPDAIQFRFGPQSFSAHKRETAARGIPAKVLRIDSLARDIDEPDDLAEFLSHPAETATHRLLASMGITSRMGGGS